MSHHISACVATVAAAALCGTLAATPAGGTTAAGPILTDRRAELTIAIHSEPHVVVGDVVKVKGHLSPRAAGDPARLQVKYRGTHRWKTLESTTLNRRGRYRFSELIGSPRSRDYRVVRPPAPDRRVRRSHSVTVKPYAWYLASTLRAPVASDTVVPTTATMSGVVYPYSLRAAANPARWEVVSDYTCLLLDATFGLEDSSPAGSSATFTFSSVAGPASTTVTYFKGQTAHVVTGVQSYDFWFDITTTDGGIAVIGNPRLLCQLGAGGEHVPTTPNP